MNTWSPYSWQDFPSKQLPNYTHAKDVQRVTSELQQRPGLVALEEIQALRRCLSLAVENKSFILQGGDCAECFSDCTRASIRAKLKIILQMSQLLHIALEKPIITIGRIAGQFAKPRTLLIENQDGQSLPSYQGDIINQPHFNETARTADPTRMITGYEHAAYTMGYLRTLLTENTSNLEFPFFTSHEALLLPYEAALTRYHALQGIWYNSATHFPWLGVRTAQLDSPHVEYLSGIVNPIGIKIGPDQSNAHIVKLLAKLNPEKQTGKIMLIHRFGAKQIQSQLPALINAVYDTQQPVVWCCDPMHGNTQLTGHGYKTRYFDDIVFEVKQALNIHDQQDTPLNGLHFEVTPENVTECIGGSSGISESDLPLAYKSLVDPRLNYQQGLEIAALVSEHISTQLLEPKR